MDERFRRVCDLFDEARRLPAGAARARYLDDACAPDLRAEVDSMLAHHDASADADSIAAIGPELARVWREAARPAPRRIGSYRVIRELGSGGSGTVYEAEQESPRRRVALKVLHAGLSPRARDRLQQEGEILAQLSHEGVARIHAMEGNAIVMELVEGVPVNRHAQDLPLRARLELLARVADIVAHAHQRGVIHRDLKPSNILVDAAGNPKVLDFGLARRLEAEACTATGVVMGTLGYLSPEQADGRSDEMDTRTDVYALGVLGYELLTGRLPHETENRPITDVLIAIGSEDAPPLSDHDRNLRGDLTVIVAKALARDREERYQSADAFADDLRRYLRDEPILARGPAAAYQLRKFVRRNKLLVTSVLATMLALVVGLGVALRFAREAKDNAQAKERALARARIEAAASDLRLHRPANAQRSLALVPEPLRGWEWGHLAHRLAGRGDAAAWGAPVDPFFWPAELAPWWSRPGWRDWLAAFHPSGLLCAETGLLDAAHGTPSPLEARAIVALASSADGGRVVVSGTDLRWQEGPGSVTGTVVIGGTPRRVLFHDEGTASYVGISADGALVGYPLGDYRMTVVDVDTGERHTFRHGHYRSPYAFAFSPDHRFVATATNDFSVRVHDWRTGETVRVSRSHTAAVFALAWSPDNRYLASGGGDRTVSLWDLSSGDRTVLLGCIADIRTLRFSTDGQRVWALTKHGRRSWPVPDGTDDVLRWHTAAEEGNRYPYVYGVGFSADGERLASGAWDCTVRVVDPATGGLERTWELGTIVEAVAFLGPRLVAATRRGVFVSGAERPVLEGRYGVLAVRPDGGAFAAAPGQHAAGLTIVEGTTRRPLADDASWYALAWSPDGRRLATGGYAGEFRVLDAATGRTTRRLTLGRDRCRAVVWNRRMLAAACGDVVHLLDTPRAVLEGHASEIYALAFHPDGSRLAAGCYDGTIWIWDPVAREKRLELRGHTAYVYDLAWSPDGTVLASASGDNTVRLWRGG